MLWNNNYAYLTDGEMKSELIYVKLGILSGIKYVLKNISYSSYLFCTVSVSHPLTISFEFSEILFPFNMHSPIAKMHFLISPGYKFGG